MNRYALVLAIALLSTLAASAQGVYQIKIRGSLISSTGHTHIKETDLVVTNGHFLIYEVNLPDRQFDLKEVFANGDLFRDNTHSHEGAVVSNNKVSFDLHYDFGFDGNVGGIRPFAGRLMAVGRVTERSLRFSVVGAWDPDTLFKGVITGKRIFP